MATTAGSTRGRARFAAACGVLSRYVKAAAMEAESRPAAAATPIALALMPGADVSPTQEELEPATSRALQAQMTIFYGGRVVVLDAVDPDQAAELLRLAGSGAGAAAKDEAARVDLLPMARKASLQRFMEKRSGRVAARATPYSRTVSSSRCDLQL
jgi:jasmonate ZIM domain-containing protein